MEEQIIHFTQNDYEITKREVLYKGFFRMVLDTIKHKKFDGSWTGEFTREIIERPHAIGVLPYDPVLDQVILIQQFRAGAIANPESPWLIEIIAGLYEVNESPDTTTIREAKEEAGLDLLDLYPIYEYFVSPGGSTETLKLYCARVDASNAGGIYGVDNENEDIRAFAVSLDDALEMVQSGKIKTSPAIIVLQWLQLNKEWLKQLWQK